MRSPIKLFTFAIFIGTAIFPIYAFASPVSTVKSSGEGAATISGWTVSNIHYELSESPSFIQGVSFDLDAPAGTVSVKLSSTSPTYASCLNVTGYHWQCDLPSRVSISSLDEIHLIAVGN